MTSDEERKEAASAEDGPTFRADFVFEDLEFDEEARTLRFRLAPDPRRYRRVDEDDRHGWYDPIESMFLTDELLKNTAPQMVGLPFYFQQQQIGNAEEYVKARSAEIEAQLDGEPPAGELRDASQEFLSSLDVRALRFAFLSIDVVGSTSLASRLSGEVYGRIISTLLGELSLLVPAFHGHVLKYTGDGLIAYFPEPAFITKNDLALDCALVMRMLVHDALNPALLQRDLPPIEVRVGVDSGKALVVTMGSELTKRETDLLGLTLSLAAKVQSLAKPGEVLVGQTSDENLHIAWREQLEEIGLPDDWKYTNWEGGLYRVYRFGRRPDSPPRGPVGHH